MAIIKKAQQENLAYVNDGEILGEIDVNNYSLNVIIEKVYKHYSEANSQHTWSIKDYKECYGWIYKAIEFNNGMFDPRNCNILQPEQKFDLVIEKPWAKYEYNIDGQKVDGYLGLKGTIDLITKVNDTTVEVVDYKGLPIDTLIPTPEGWNTMGALKIGDKVFDQNGKICNIIGKSKIKIKPCYKITFDDKNSVICDNEHLWSLHNGEVKCVKELKINDKINVPKPLDCQEKEMPIEPYFLGLWLGDGRNRGAELTIGDKDIDILSHLINKGHKLGKLCRYKDRKITSVTILKMTHKLRELNLLHNKHIPDIYLRASYEQRLELLRGLMDSDGSVNLIRKQCVFTNCDEKLIDDVKELLLTMGQRVHKDSRIVSTNFKENVLVHNLFFRPINNINPFVSYRKSQLVDPDWRNGKSDIRRIIKIAKVKKRKTQCIAVDSADNTYLCTKNFIPTHNSGKRLDWATGQEKTQEKLEKDAQLRIYHYAVKKLYPYIDTVIFTIYYVNDGGPFSMVFHDSDLIETENMLRQKFEIIKNTRKPRLNKSWMCSKICHFGKTTFENTHVEPLEEYRDNHTCKKGSIMTKCEQVKHNLDLYGIDATMSIYKHPNHTVGYYQAPGST